MKSKTLGIIQILLGVLALFTAFVQEGYLLINDFGVLKGIFYMVFFAPTTSFGVFAIVTGVYFILKK